MKKKVLLLSGLGLGLLGTGVASADEVYTVVQGDTVSSIAQKFNTTVEKIDEKNNLTDVNMISVGQKLTIPTLVTSQNTYVAPVKQQTVQYTQPVVQNTTQTTQQTVKQQNTQKVVQQPVQKVVTQQPVVKQQVKTSSVQNSGGSVKQRFLAAGGTEALWNSIVMPESGGNPNAVSPNGYRGLGQTKEGWATGSVEQQTKGMVDYCNRRYGGISQAIAFRQANGWY